MKIETHEDAINMLTDIFLKDKDKELKILSAKQNPNGSIAIMVAENKDVDQVVIHTVTSVKTNNPFKPIIMTAGPLIGLDGKALQ